MRHIITSIAVFAFVVTGFMHLNAQGTLLDCNSCDDETPSFTLFLEPKVAPPTNGPNGFGTTEAQIDVHLFNNSSSAVEMATIEFSMGINDAQLTSLIDVTTDAVHFPNEQQIVFTPNFSSVTIIDNPPVAMAKTINGHSYTHHYEYDETVNGDQFPTHVIAAGATEHILTVYLTFDGSQQFVDTNPASSMYLGSSKYLVGYPGECLDNDPNINNQFGFVAGGKQLLNNCYKVVTGSPNGGLGGLTVFTGEIRDEVNRLAWRTEVEVNTAWHAVERTTNLETEPFVEIGKVPAGGNTDDVTNYLLNDDAPPSLAYYRLRTSGKDGNIQYSEIVVLKRDSDFDLLSVYPNPTLGEFEVKYSLDSDADITVEIVDVLGRVLQTETFAESEGIMKREFDISQYSDGIYILRITDGVETKSKEVVKSRP
ncbi:MAG: T9SS type A sorting domain-containing protein [Bacteroidota bacterium]